MPVGVQTLVCLGIQDNTHAKARTPTWTISSKEAILKLPHLIIAVQSSNVERLFVVWSPEFIEPTKLSPPYPVQVFRKEGRDYKIDLTQTKSPFFQALQRGEWKQFGSPKDYTGMDEKDND